MRRRRISARMVRIRTLDPAPNHQTEPPHDGNHRSTLDARRSTLDARRSTLDARRSPDTLPRRHSSRILRRSYLLRAVAASEAVASVRFCSLFFADRLSPCRRWLKGCRGVRFQGCRVVRAVAASKGCRGVRFRAVAASDFVLGSSWFFGCRGVRFCSSLAVAASDFWLSRRQILFLVLRRRPFSTASLASLDGVGCRGVRFLAVAASDFVLGSSTTTLLHSVVGFARWWRQPVRTGWQCYDVVGYQRLRVVKVIALRGSRQSMESARPDGFSKYRWPLLLSGHSVRLRSAGAATAVETWFHFLG